MRAGLGADVVKIDATFLVALVFGATSHPIAAFFASRIIGTGLKLFALHLLIHVAASTLDDGGFVARRAFSEVALGNAHVVGTRRTTEQLLSTNGLAYRDRIQAGFAFSFDDCLFATRTGRNNFRRKRTLTTRPRVAKFRAVVILATKFGITNGFTTEPSFV